MAVTEGFNSLLRSKTNSKTLSPALAIPMMRCKSNVLPVMSSFSAKNQPIPAERTAEIAPTMTINRMPERKECLKLPRVKSSIKAATKSKAIGK